MKLFCDKMYKMSKQNLGIWDESRYEETYLQKSKQYHEAPVPSYFHFKDKAYYLRLISANQSDAFRDCCTCFFKLSITYLPFYWYVMYKFTLQFIFCI